MILNIKIIIFKGINLTQIKNMKFKKSLLCFLILSGALLKAEEKYQLNDVVVSASGFEQDLVDAPLLVFLSLQKKSLKKSQLRI